MLRNRTDNGEKNVFVFPAPGLWTADETVQENEWRARFRDIDQITLLQENWDGEGAEIPNYALLQSVKDLLHRMYSRQEPPPSRIMPTPDGTIVIEWQAQQTYRECEVAEPYHAEWFVRYPDGTSVAWEESWLPPSETWVVDWPQGGEGQRQSAYLWEREYLAA